MTHLVSGLAPMLSRIFSWRWPLLVGVALVLGACGGGGGTSVAGSGNGTSSAASAPVSVSVTLAQTNVVSGQATTLSWSSSGASSCSASGAWSGAQATSGSVTVRQPLVGTYDYTLSCSGASGQASSSATLAVAAGVANTLAMVVDNGPAAAGGSINVPFVSVTVCQPGTSTCQTIDHVMVDTGSFGLRLIGPLSSALALPAVTTPSGAPAYECAQFISGYGWGAVQQADVKLAGEVASSIPIQVIGAGAPAVPSDCRSTGTSLGSVAALGANGILGIGMFAQDCGSLCAARAVAATYYGCSGASCTASAMPLAKQVGNPVSAFAVDNNGVVLNFPAVKTGGAAALSGTLVFGIGTQLNNMIGSETVYSANSSGNFTTTYKGNVWSASFLDSGSNGLFFSDGTLALCSFSSEFYCPTSELSLSATNAAADGSTSGTVNFFIENVDALPTAIIAANIGGTNGGAASAKSFDWGLPFFFGRRVFVGIEGTGTKPYWAY